MKFNPTPKEARALGDPIKERELRRLICKEINEMTAEQLQKLLWAIQRKRG